VARQEIARHGGDPYESIRYYPHAIPHIEGWSAAGRKLNPTAFAGKTLVIIFSDLSESSEQLVKRAADAVGRLPTRRAMVLAVIERRAWPAWARRRLPSSGQCLGIFDADRSLANRFGIRRFPSVLLVGPNGIVNEVLLNPRLEDLDECWAERIGYFTRQQTTAPLRVESRSQLKLKQGGFRCVGGVREIEGTPDGPLVTTFLGDTLLFKKDGSLILTRRDKGAKKAPQKMPRDTTALEVHGETVENADKTQFVGPGAENLILINGTLGRKTGYLALEDQSGRPLWEAETAPGKPLACFIGAQELAIATPSGFVGRMYLLDHPPSAARDLR